MMKMELVERLVITRPLVQVGKDMGYLPGDIDSKVGPYVQPCFDELLCYLSHSMLKQLARDRKIEIVPLSMMRGRTFKNAVVVLDEAQNSIRVELKTLLTRIGLGSKFILVGDTQQSDLPDHEQGAFLDAMERLQGLPMVNSVHLSNTDIVRHPLIGPITDRLW